MTIVALVLTARRRGVARAGLCAALLVVSVGLSDLGSGAIKSAVGRPRPLNALPGVWFREDGQWQRRPDDFAPAMRAGSSFVSAHAANAMAFAVTATAVWPGAGPVLVLAPLLVGHSRIYLGKHYPSDVLAGWLVGLTASWLVLVAWRLVRGGGARSDQAKEGGGAA